MESQRSVEVKVGMVSIGAVILLIAGIMLARGYNVSKTEQTLRVRVPYSGGIEPASIVTVNGVKRGTVTSVENDKGSVLVTAVLDDISDLHADASAQISMLEITGGKKMEIDPGVSPQKFSPQYELRGKVAPDIGEVLAIVGDVADDAKSLVRRLDTISGSLTNLLADGKVVTQLRQTVDNAADLTGTLREFVNDNRAQLQQSLSDLNLTLREVRRAVEVNSPKVDILVNKLDRIASNAESLLGKVDTTVEGANELIGDVRGVVRDVREGKGLASKLIYDERFAARTDSVVQNLDQMLRDIERYGLNLNVRIGRFGRNP